MSRPKRLASQQTAKQKLDLSDLSESDGDFSSESSDEYNPNKSKNNESSLREDSEDEENSGEESPDDSSAEEDSFTESVKDKSRKSNSKNRSIATLRKEAINKFMKRQSANLSSSSQKIQDILKKAQYNKKGVFSSDSEDKAPKFDCSAGLKLSDSEMSNDEEDNDNKAPAKSAEKRSLINSINEESGKPMTDLKSIHDNLERMKKAKEKLSNYNANGSTNTNDQNDIANLLAMGENSKKQASASQKRSNKKATQDSDTEWEEVEEDDSKSYKAPKEGVEIMLNAFGDHEKKSKDAKPVDIEAQLKRKFNRKRKEFQEHLHKTELMCWLSHCNYVNEHLNNPNLMQQALKMLPATKNKSQCYPKDKTDFDYFTQITKWFKQTIGLKNTDMYCKLKKRPSLLMSLALQIKQKEAICRRDYVLLFVVLLRAIGVQCRMTQSLVMDPKICPKTELMSLSKKDEPKKSTKDSKKSSSNSKTANKSSSTKKSTKSDGKKLKISQLDGAHDELPTSKAKKPIKIKGTSEYDVDESFIDLKKLKQSTPKPVKNDLSGPQCMSPTIKMALSSSNLNKMTVSDKLKKNLKVISPRKTRSASREAPSRDVERDLPKNVGNAKSASKNADSSTENVQIAAGNSTKRTVSATRSSKNVSGTNKSASNISKNASGTTKDVSNIERNSSRSEKAPKTSKMEAKPENSANNLKVFSPRRLRSRSKSHDNQNTSTSIDKSKKAANKKEISEKPKLKNLTKKDNLKVFSPRRMRSRSRSTDVSSQNVSKNDRNQENKVKNAIKRNLSGKNENFIEKKQKMVETRISSRKRPASSTSEVETKKMKKTAEDEFSDDSLKYFKDISSGKSSTKKKAPKSDPKPSTSRDIDRRVFSSDDEADAATDVNMNSSSPKKSKGIDIWVEVYCEKEDKWIAIDIFRGKIDCVKEICRNATHPLIYVFSWNNDKTVKDVSARYCSNLNTTVRKMRVDREYLYPILKLFNVNYTRTSRDLKEDDELNKVQFDTPMPKSIAEFKNHPLYVLKRHLLKYQAIYPPEPPILGYIRDEAIYPRDCCFQLHSRETWLKEARVVKLNEKPYKIVKTLRWDRAKNKLMKDIPLELFGIWQTKDYEPPVAENGIVPRNAYGNVELFKPSMLPIGTVHLQLPGLSRICKKLGVDCSQAIVGFDSNGGWPFPVYDGFVICKEFEQKVIDAWTKEQDEVEAKEKDKYEKRVYGNWKKLIKGLLIRERLKKKYNNFEDSK